jgi:hypothetical protein
MEDISELAAAVALGRSFVAKASGRVQMQRDKLAKIDADITDCEGKLARRRELEREDAIKLVLAGEGAGTPDKPKRKAQIANLEEHLFALKAARPVQQEHLNSALDAERAARSSFSKAIIPHLAGLRARVFQRCGPALNQLIDGLASASTIDVLQDQMVGDEVYPDACEVEGLFRAGVILERLKSGMAPRLRGLLDERFKYIDQLIAERADAVLRHIDLTNNPDDVLGENI